MTADLVIAILALFFLLRSRSSAAVPSSHLGIVPAGGVAPGGMPAAAKPTAAVPKTGGGPGLSFGAPSASAATSGAAMASQLPAWMLPLTSYQGNQVATISSAPLSESIANVAAPTYTAPDMSSWIDSAIASGSSSGNTSDATLSDSAVGSYSWDNSSDYTGGDGAFVDTYF